MNNDTTINKRAAKTVSLMVLATALSKVLGLPRDMLQAAVFGTESAEINAFTAASQIPLSFFDILFGAAILGIFIPVYNSIVAQNEGNPDKADEFAAVFINVIALITGFLTLLGILFSPQIISLAAPLLDTNTAEIASRLLRVMFPIVLCSSLAYSLVGILQSKGNFLVPAMMSAVSNIVLILYLLVFNRFFSITGLAAAYLLAWFVQLVTLAIPLFRMKFRLRFSIDVRNDSFRQVLRNSLPVMAGSWLIPFGRIIALQFAGESITAFDFANKVYMLVAGIITYGICNYIFPKLSKLSASDDTESFYLLVRSGTAASMFITVPIAIGAFALSGEIISVLFRHGEFTADAAIATGAALRYMSAAMIAYSFNEVMQRVYYARDKVKIPMLAALVGITVNFLLTFLLTKKTDMGLNGVAFSNAAGQISCALVMAISASSAIKGAFNRRFIGDMIKYAVSGGLSLTVMLILHKFIAGTASETGALKNLTVCVIVFAAGLIVYFAAAVILKASLLARKK